MCLDYEDKTRPLNQSVCCNYTNSLTVNVSYSLCLLCVFCVRFNYLIDRFSTDKVLLGLFKCQVNKKCSRIGLHSSLISHSLTFPSL